MFTTFVNLLTLVFTAPYFKREKHVVQLRRTSQKPSHKWITFCQWYFPRLSEKDYFALVHLSVNNVLPLLLKQLLLYGPDYRIILPNNMISNLVYNIYHHSIEELVEMIEVLLMFERKMGENVLEDGSCLVDIFKDVIILAIEQTKNDIILVETPDAMDDSLIRNPNITSNNMNITWDIVQSYSYKPWDWRSLCKIPNITSKDLQSLYKPLNFWVGVLQVMGEKKILTSEEIKMQTVLSLLINEKGREFGDCFKAHIWPELKKQEN